MKLFSETLNTSIIKPISVLDIPNTGENYVSIDLSETNTVLDQVDVSSSEKFSQYIESYLTSNKADVAFGGYLEPRNIYKRSLHFNREDNLTERNIHLGIDLWYSAGTAVLAALDGEVHSFKNNTNYGDYGPTIILKHQVAGIEFYTLYGHLSLESITSITVGEKVKQGQSIGSLGTPGVNGDYPPHLHFQIIKDLQGYVGDYPGVCNIRDLEFYKMNCPDPNILLKLFEK
ncbi:peptidoglycan DD-metalloendopeptidase family protein [Aestuariibaculum lutulentum]|uniref:Peptidoglycan DD-metalloendopeptidase family protein n=1 Tax=Aestuariibaculum lutulentum TaxID=2920935 RepID=A0ABS9RE88_9FLAO|nr:peptidoglycan DD-metalloendopeptidase family protein [Aestuariibaculum lutulentum]MCH4551264.1 peptidoglycan DD-metalloendopeptidase family protein [Aestuariibaculum lutulentum]